MYKHNIFFFLNSLSFVFTTNLSKDNGKIINEFSDKTIDIVFNDGIKKISRMKLKNEYLILVDDDVFNMKEIRIDCLNMNILEIFKILKKLYEDKIIEDFNKEEFKTYLFKEINFKTFLCFLRKFGKNNFEINKFWFLAYVDHFLDKNISKDNQVCFYNDLIRKKKFKSILEFICVFFYIKRQIIIKFADIQCYIKIFLKMNKQRNEFLYLNYRFRIFQEEHNVSLNNCNFKSNPSPLLSFLRRFVKFYKKDCKESKFTFNVVINKKFKNHLQQYGREFVKGLKNIVTENNIGANSGGKRFEYNVFLRPNTLHTENSAYVFDLKERKEEVQTTIKILVCFGDVSLPLD